VGGKCLKPNRFTPILRSANAHRPYIVREQNAHTTDIEAVICIGEAFYCNAAGHSQKQADIAQHNAKAEAFKQRLLSLRPALTFTAFNSTKEKSA